MHESAPLALLHEGVAVQEVYTAIFEDLTHLGGPMGTEYTTEHTLGVFATIEGAKKACEKHYQQHTTRGARLRGWRKDKKSIRTDDLGWAMYHVRPTEVGA